jgi:hypothetical protein
VVLFSAKEEVSPMFAALSSMPDFDLGANLSALPASEAKRPGYAFFQVHAPSEAMEEESSKRSLLATEQDALGAADLGVHTLPALFVLHGSSLADFKLAQLTAADLAEAAKGGRLAGRFPGVPGTAAAMKKWLKEHNKAVSSRRA